jgi:glycosyltransferase involved in cell wall biosynthesis
MTVYNGEKYLQEQLRSVLEQLTEADEVIIVDDASTDRSVELVRATADSRVKLHCNPINKGVRQSFELGLRQATREILFLCDQDDVWLPGKRNAFVATFERHPGTKIVISDAEVIDADGRLTVNSFMATRGGFQASLCSTLIKNRYLGCAMALHRSLLPSVLPIPASVPMHDMWIGGLGSLMGGVQYISRPYLQYRRHGENVSPSRPQGKMQMLRWRMALLGLVIRRCCAVRLSRRSTA